MSMNIHIKAVAKAMIISTGEEFDHVFNLSVFQTPTNVTRKIMESDNKLEEYENHVNSISVTETRPVFAEDDIFHEGDPVGHDTFNLGEEHLKELHSEIDHFKKRGFEIVFEMM